MRGGLRNAGLEPQLVSPPAEHLTNAFAEVVQRVFLGCGTQRPIGEREAAHDAIRAHAQHACGA
jgi:hypothetical protein